MKKVVVKIGRNIATSESNTIDEDRFEQFARQIKVLQEHDIFVILVVSAAVCCGEQELGLTGPYNITKDLVAGVGQAAIMAKLHRIFREHNLKIAQLLVTRTDLQDKQKRNNITNVIHQASERNIVLVVNENDIAELHSFDGNDYLAAEIAAIAHANSLLFLTDVDGVFDDKMQVMKFTLKTKALHKL
jgi:glutamate 5-kinase